MKYKWKWTSFGLIFSFQGELPKTYSKPKYWMRTADKFEFVWIPFCELRPHAVWMSYFQKSGTNFIIFKVQWMSLYKNFFGYLGKDQIDKNWYGTMISFKFTFLIQIRLYICSFVLPLRLFTFHSIEADSKLGILKEWLKSSKQFFG